jgi:hypothetical protein
MLDFIRDAYDVFAQLNLSVTGLIAMSVILALAFLFSVREAASWFFKIDDVQRDIMRLRDVVRQLEVEIKSLHSQLGTLTGTPKTDIAFAPTVAQKTKATPKRAQLAIQNSNFPIVH